MIKKYDFYYEEGKYVLKFKNPNATEQPFEINMDDMQFDTKRFYMYMFSDVKESISIVIKNGINVDELDKDVAKKGERVYRVIEDLCTEITNKINKECFGDDSRSNN